MYDGSNKLFLREKLMEESPSYGMWLILRIKEGKYRRLSGISSLLEVFL